MVVTSHNSDMKHPKYYQVDYINHEYNDTLSSLGIQVITHAMWEETAFALDIPISELTVDCFMAHVYSVYKY